MEESGLRKSGRERAMGTRHWALAELEGEGFGAWDSGFGGAAPRGAGCALAERSAESAGGISAPSGMTGESWPGIREIKRRERTRAQTARAGG